MSSPYLTSSRPVAKGIVIHEPVNFDPTEAGSSGKDKSPIETWPSALAISVHFPGNLRDLMHKQCGELLGYLGTKADVVSVA